MIWIIDIVRKGSLKGHGTEGTKEAEVKEGKEKEGRKRRIKMCDNVNPGRTQLQSTVTVNTAFHYLQRTIHVYK